MSDIIDRLQHSADMQYRMSGSADEMLHDAIAEIRKLREEMPVAKSLETEISCITIERNKARDVVWQQAEENANLRAEVERLRDALTEISKYETSAPAGFEWDIVVEEIVEIARKALEAKP